MIRDFIRDVLLRYRRQRDIEAWSRVVVADLEAFPPIYIGRGIYDHERTRDFG
jgi:hypothetical protein